MGANSHEKVLRWIYGIVGFVYLAWGIVQLVFTGTSPCALRFSTSNAFRTGGGADDSGWQLPFFKLTVNQYTVSILFGVALTFEGLYLAAISWFNRSWARHWDEIVVKANRQRWIRWAVSDALLLPGIAYIAGITDDIAISAFAVVAIGSNFAQAYNETVNSALVDQDTGKVRIVRDSVSSDNPWESVPRVDGWLIALLIAGWAFIVWYVAMANGVSTNVSGVLFAVPIVWGALYVVMHLVILFVTTNYAIFGGRSWTYRREYVFIGFRLAMLAYTTIAAAVVQNAATCPT